MVVHIIQPRMSVKSSTFQKCICCIATLIVHVALYIHGSYRQNAKKYTPLELYNVHEQNPIFAAINPYPSQVPHNITAGMLRWRKVLHYVLAACGTVVWAECASIRCRRVPIDIVPSLVVLFFRLHGTVQVVKHRTSDVSNH